MPIPHAHRSYDTRKARAFYTALFGWEYTEVPAVAGDYAFVSSGGTTFGAVTAANTDPPSWLAHVGVEDVRAATVKARALGARGEVECQPFGRLGTLSVIVDPTGARVGLMAFRPAISLSLSYRLAARRRFRGRLAIAFLLALLSARFLAHLVFPPATSSSASFRHVHLSARGRGLLFGLTEGDWITAQRDRAAL